MNPREPIFDLDRGLHLFRWGDTSAQLRRYYPRVDYGITDMYAFQKVHIIEEFIELADGSWLDCHVGKPSHDQSIWMRAYEVGDPLPALMPLLEKIGVEAAPDGVETLSKWGRTDVAVSFERGEISIWIDHTFGS